MKPENPMKPMALFLVLTFAGTACAQAGERHHATILAQASSGARQVCTEVYQPVCGTNSSGMRVTYSNACFARAASATDVSPGECANPK